MNFPSVLREIASCLTDFVVSPPLRPLARVGHLEFSNIGRSTCSLTGFPEVAATTLRRVELGAPAVREYGVPATTIDIAPGATAHSLIGYVASRVNAACKPESAGFLQVSPPNYPGSKRAFFPLPVCTTGRVDLNVRRVAAGF
jgi:hypothetical protein